MFNKFLSRNKFTVCLLLGWFFINLSEPSVIRGVSEIISLPDPEIYMLSVGIEEYPNNKIEFATKDAIAFTKAIKKNGGFSVKKNVLLLDAEATRESIIESLESMAKEITSNDIFIFHFAGAGYTVNEEQFYLYPSGFNWNPTSQLTKEKEEKAISGDLLKSYFARIRAETKILIFDTGISSFVCRQGDSFFSQSGGKSLFIGTNNNSLENRIKQQGAVTGLFLDAVKGNADSNYDDIISAWEVLAFLGNAAYRRKVLDPESQIKFCTSTQGENFPVALSDRKVDERTVAEEERKKANSENNGSYAIELDKPQEKPKKRDGDDYALLFAFDEFSEGWTKLRNPQNDIRAVEFELVNRYKFKEVIPYVNLTVEEFDKVIDEYKKKNFKPDDQLFIFFAGHGFADKNLANNGYLVAKNSLSPNLFSPRKTDSFIKLDQLLGDLSSINSQHIMIVFDACFSGQIWRPSFTIVKSELAFDTYPLNRDKPLNLPIFGFQPMENVVSGYTFQQEDNKLTKDEMINRELENYSRVVLTSGHDVVSDGKPKKHSPFAAQFLEALRTGADENGLLTLPVIMSEVKKARNKTPAELGRIDKQGEKSTGGFIFCQGGCN